MSVDRSDTSKQSGWRLIIEEADLLSPMAALFAIVLLSLGLWSAIWLAVSYLAL
jgi:hypothetical protein